MLLGKRPRPPIKRTTSMTGITVGDDSDVEPVQPSQSFLAMVSPRSNHSHDPAHQPAHFLTSCGLCRRRLAPGRDIYMYRGDAAFCSLECRERQMKQDEKKEKLSLMSNHHHHQQQQQQEENNNNNNKNASTKSHTIVAA